MTDYLFNSASLQPAYTDLDAVELELVALLSGLAELDSDAEVLPGFRLPTNPWLLNVAVIDGKPVSLGSVGQRLYETGHVESADYFHSLQMMAPADFDASPEVIESALRLEITGEAKGHRHCFILAEAAGLDAVLSALAGHLLVSLSRAGRWDVDHLAFHASGSDYILDHVSDEKGARSVAARRKRESRTRLTVRNFWAARTTTFPHLKFGQGVERQIRSLDSRLVNLTFRRLADLDHRTAVWQTTGSFPESLPVITRESIPTMKAHGLARNFRDEDGVVRCFEEHIWIDDLFRIHLLKRTTGGERTVCIGYIGRHLPTVTQST